MDGKPSVVNVICLVAEKVEELGIHDRHDEIEGVIGIGMMTNSAVFRSPMVSSSISS